MFDRIDFKSKAKKVLRLNYWKAFVACIIVGFAFGGGVGAGNSHVLLFLTEQISSLSMERILMLILPVLMIVLLLLLLRVLVGYYAYIGGMRYFLNINAVKKCSLNELTFGLNNGRWKNILSTMIYKDVKVFLWSLLFLIPGVIKHYSYAMVPYLLAENPGMDKKQALQLSMKMTEGYRVDMLMLDFSFIGWYLIGVFTFGIGLLFLNPYIETTRAQMYYFLRKEAIRKKMLNEELLRETIVIE